MRAQRTVMAFFRPPRGFPGPERRQSRFEEFVRRIRKRKGSSGEKARAMKT